MKVLLTGGNGFVGINIVNEMITYTDWDITCLINNNDENIPGKIHRIYD